MDGHTLGGARTFVIAEAGVNHNGSLPMARQLVDAAREAGADAVKFQTFRPEGVVSRQAPKAAYQLRTTDPAESQLAMLRELALNEDDYRQLQQYSAEQGITFLSTPFDNASADLLAAMDVPAFKLGSSELTNLPFLDVVGRKGKPVIFSTGLGTIGEVDAAMHTLYAAGCTHVAVLHCVTNYPADPADANLRAIATLRAAFQVPTGYSDHTMGTAVPIAAVALGACIIEKHLTLDTSLPGPDHASSLEPGDFARMVEGIREVEQALGHGRKVPTAHEAANMQAVRRSLVARHAIPAGTRLTAEMLTAKRPGTGLPPSMLAYCVGLTVRHDLAEDQVLTMESFMDTTA